MYESRFGITGPPFQLSPDPTFYFDSRGHHRALGELRAALDRDSGFIVVSGEVGAGKTTLVRTLLAEIDTTHLAVAHVVSTQLDADELLAAACIGFGLQVGGTPTLTITPTTLNFAYQVGTSFPNQQSIAIASSTQTQVSYNVTSFVSSGNTNWLVVSPQGVSAKIGRAHV